MNAGRFDVLHQPTDQHGAAAIGEGIHIHLDGVFQVLIDQHRVIGFHLHGLHHVAIELLLVVHHLHGAAAKHIAGPHHHRIANPLGHRPRFGLTAGQAVAGLADLELAQDRLELLPVFGAVDRFRGGAPQAGARGQPGRGGKPAQQRYRQLEGRLATELHDHPFGPLGFDHIEHVLEGERLEVEAIAGVVVRRHGFGVAVHHHRGEARIPQGKGGVAAAVVEFDALADPVGSAAQDHHLAAAFGLNLIGRRLDLQLPIGAEPLQGPFIG